ncbi:KH domain-containing protein [Candidatus Saccharibacteria bacterium]|nr:KH domain-containing protein [Candidatus Saccharibacteria bacterium]
MDDSITYAKKYLEDLLSFFGLNTDVHASHDEDVIELSIPSTHMNGFLIGQRGDTMRALQYMVSNALKCQGHKYTRVNVDVADYKKHRADRLASQVKVWAEEVKKSGEPKELQPMNSADRRVVHQVASEYSLDTESIGEGRDRRVVIMPSEGVEVDESSEATEKATK